MACAHAHAHRRTRTHARTRTHHTRRVQMASVVAFANHADNAAQLAQHGLPKAEAFVLAASAVRHDAPRILLQAAYTPIQAVGLIAVVVPKGGHSRCNMKYTARNMQHEACNVHQHCIGRAQPTSDHAAARMAGRAGWMGHGAAGWATAMKACSAAHVDVHCFATCRSRTSGSKSRAHCAAPNSATAPTRACGSSRRCWLRLSGSEHTDQRCLCACGSKLTPIGLCARVCVPVAGA